MVLYAAVFFFGVLIGMLVLGFLVGKNLRAMREQIEFEEELRLGWDQPPD
jgi:hypothetical protein